MPAGWCPGHWPRLPAWKHPHAAPAPWFPCGNGPPWFRRQLRRMGSPVGGSILITSAPRSAKSLPHRTPFSSLKSSILNPPRSEFSFFWIMLNPLDVKNGGGCSAEKTGPWITGSMKKAGCKNRIKPPRPVSEALSGIRRKPWSGGRVFPWFFPDTPANKPSGCRPQVRRHAPSY
jgi:hypothetical protein